ncbi:hypothetical protein VTP01DRAFT_5098, partial [Rhizomucor pusillus]|uniref:uncharacterized protein n=1 Tax=Rhizomucor pusillus TaxID=4840 RepID=UPI0037430265
MFDITGANFQVLHFVNSLSRSCYIFIVSIQVKGISPCFPSKLVILANWSIFRVTGPLTGLLTVVTTRKKRRRPSSISSFTQFGWSFMFRSVMLQPLAPDLLHSGPTQWRFC